MSIEEYNKEPVFYCKDCLSLKIRHIPDMEESEFCEACDSSNIGTSTIDVWDNLYIQKYGSSFLNL